MTSPNTPLDVEALEAVARAVLGLDEEYDESTPVELAAIEKFWATFDPPTILRLLAERRELVDSAERDVALLGELYTWLHEQWVGTGSLETDGTVSADTKAMRDRVFVRWQNARRLALSASPTGRGE